jgi:hypothetical protein
MTLSLDRVPLLLKRCSSKYPAPEINMVATPGLPYCLFAHGGCPSKNDTLQETRIMISLKSLVKKDAV